MRRFLVLLALTTAFACSDDEAPPPPAPSCPPEVTAFRFEHGSAEGHADPFGAKAAKQARAGKIKDAAQIVQAADARHKVRVGDFILANDKIAVYIESENRPNGYSPFGGDILAIEPVGDNGKPAGLSRYNETLIALSRQTVKPDRVSVLADGSDGKAAIVRVAGMLTNIPFLDTFHALSPEEYNLPGAIDYVLESGAEKVLYRLSLANTNPDLVAFTNKQRLGFFQYSRSKVFTESQAYGPPKDKNPYVAYDSGTSGFLYKFVGGEIQTEIYVSGFQLFSVEGLSVDACAKKTIDYFEITTGGPGIDGLLEAKRRAYGEPAWREVKGTVKEEGGAALGGAYVHASAPDGKYLTRALANDKGEFTLHVPAGPVGLTPTMKGWEIPAAKNVDGATVDLVLPKRATIDVTVTDATTNEPLPVRVQVLPTKAIARAPASFGLREEETGLWQEFALTGKATLPVPPGDYRVVVSRGYEYELVDMPVTASTTAPGVVNVKLAHSVDSTGFMCADFHEHSFYSADSADPVEDKVKGAIADGLDIPVSSEHEWVIDFHPVVEKLGMSKWAFGMPSEELTTFTWGHFGIVPINPRPDATNNGAIDWVGKKPAEFFRAVNELPEKPVLIVNHPSGGGFGAYFDAAGFSQETTKGDPELWSEDFGAIEVFNDSDFEANRTKSVAAWFALLNAGKIYWAVGNSDSHDQRNAHVGYPRTCLHFGHDDPTKLTNDTVRDVLRQGAGTISGGLYMTVTSPDGKGPGETSTAGAYKVVVQWPSWIKGAATLETIIDGVTADTKPLTPLAGASGGKRAELTIDVAPSSSRPKHWVVFHAKGEGDLAPVHGKKKPFAASNPIFF